MAQASPDECFQGNANNASGITAAQISANNASFNAAYATANGYLTASQLASCISAGNLPKVNQAYVWGMTMDPSGNIWFGTAANVLCLVEDKAYGTVPAPYQDSNYVCDAQQNRQEDFKPPRMYKYNPGTNVLTDLTAEILQAGTPVAQGGTYTDPGVVSVLTSSFGVRSAGTYNGVVFFGAIYADTSTTPATAAVALFAFNATTMQYLGHQLYNQASGTWYSDSRQWHVINGNLFTGVGKIDSGVSDGSLLRWAGSLSTWVSPTNPGNLFTFVDVGDTVGQIAYFTAHSDGHIYATTWGGPAGSYTMAGSSYGMYLYMSPPLHGATGLDTSDTANWTQVWNLYQANSVGPIPGYEVEPTALQVGGAIASFGGYIYFGTMEVPGTGAQYFASLYPNSTLSATTVALDTNRPIAIFRTKGFDPTLQPTPAIDILYGSTDLEQYNATTDTFSSVPNGMGQTALYGTAGFGNVFNNYTWTMAVFQNQLYVGTMDFSYLLGTSSVASGIPAAVQTLASTFYGADLWTFADTNSAATYVSLNGMGNDTSYGIRTMVVDNNNLNLWLGMANPMNLRTDISNDPGGWKLIDFPSQNGAPIITWYNPAAIVYGTPLTATQLNATATVSGVYTYTPPLGTVLPAGANQILSLNFAPYSNGNVYADTVKITVTQEPLTATANNVTMTYGTTPPLPFTGTLTGVVNNDGITASYTFTPAPDFGIQPETPIGPTSTTPAGIYTITTTLNDPKSKLSNYSTTVTNGTLTINKASTLSAVSATAPSVLIQNSVTLTAHVASTTTGVPTGQVTFMDGSTALVPAVTLDASGNAQLPISTLAVGTHIITVVYPGDTNYLPSTSPSVSEVVQDFQFNATSSSGTSVTVLPGGLATFNFVVAPTYGSYFPSNVTLTLTGVPSTDTYTITPATIPVGSGPTTVVVQIQTSRTVSSNRSFPSGLTFAVIFLPMLGLLTLRRRARAAGIAMMVLLGQAMVLGTNGCGSSNSGLFAGASNTSTLTVTGTCGSLQHTVTLTLTVQ